MYRRLMVFCLSSQFAHSYSTITECRLIVRSSTNRRTESPGDAQDKSGRIPKTGHETKRFGIGHQSKFAEAKYVATLSVRDKLLISCTISASLALAQGSGAPAPRFDR